MPPAPSATAPDFLLTDHDFATIRALIHHRADTDVFAALQDKVTLSSLKDLDYGAAISEFHQRQTALQVSQQADVQLQKIALFNQL